LPIQLTIMFLLYISLEKRANKENKDEKMQLPTSNAWVSVFKGCFTSGTVMQELWLCLGCSVVCCFPFNIKHAKSEYSSKNRHLAQFYPTIH
uniref:Uncharacterized protein n=1 Tax=Xenopus tropicalis TaxID=8364 RepID=A0A6I8R8W1_XENTR